MLLYLVPLFLFGPWIFAIGYVLYSFGPSEESSNRRSDCLTQVLLLAPWLFHWSHQFAAYYHEKEYFSPTALAVSSFVIPLGYAAVAKTVICKLWEERLDRMNRERIAMAA